MLILSPILTTGSCKVLVFSRSGTARRDPRNPIRSSLQPMQPRPARTLLDLIVDNISKLLNLLPNT